METLDLDINNYDLHDILTLFKLEEDFSEGDLKQAKQMVLKMHPDKSKLDPKYFLFFSSAYKTLYSIFTFKNKSMKKTETDYASLVDDEERKAVLNQFFDANKKLNQPQHFNTWFNKEFEKNKVLNEVDSKGYGDWLKSDEDVEEESKQVSEKTMHAEFEKKKRELRALVPHQEVNEFYTTGFLSTSSICGDAPEEFSSDVFSQLSFQDLRKAHKESIIPITNDDYQSVRKFKNVNEMVEFRTMQEVQTKTWTESQSLAYLQNKNKLMETEASNRAFKLAKQCEETENKSKTFWGGLQKITNR
jgi:hypothetical protein